MGTVRLANRHLLTLDCTRAVTMLTVVTVFLRFNLTRKKARNGRLDHAAGTPRPRLRGSSARIVCAAYPSQGAPAPEALSVCGRGVMLRIAQVGIRWHFTTERD